MHLRLRLLAGLALAAVAHGGGTAGRTARDANMELLHDWMRLPENAPLPLSPPTPSPSLRKEVKRVQAALMQKMGARLGEKTMAEKIRMVAEHVAGAAPQQGFGIKVTKRNRATGEVTTVLDEGFGVADVDANNNAIPVTKDTRFAIASMSKSFAGLTAVQAQRRGELSITKPVIEADPSFVPAPAPGAESMTLLDMLTHKTGLGGHSYDLQWNSLSDGSAGPTLLDNLRHYAPYYPLRSRFAYNNHMFNAAGEVTARAAGKASWSALVKQRVFDPLSMTATTTTFPGASTAKLAASMGGQQRGMIEGQRDDVLDPVPAAGGMYSTTGDIATYMNALLAAHSLSDADAEHPDLHITGGDVDNLWHRHTDAPLMDVFHPDHTGGYGLGWEIADTFNGVESVYVPLPGCEETYTCERGGPGIVGGVKGPRVVHHG